MPPFQLPKSRIVVPCGEKEKTKIIFQVLDAPGRSDSDENDVRDDTST